MYVYIYIYTYIYLEGLSLSMFDGDVLFHALEHHYPRFQTVMKNPCAQDYQVHVHRTTKLFIGSVDVDRCMLFIGMHSMCTKVSTNRGKSSGVSLLDPTRDVASVKVI